MIHEPFFNLLQSNKKQIASLQIILKERHARHKLSRVLQLYVESNLKVFRNIHDSVGNQEPLLKMLEFWNSRLHSSDITISFPMKGNY